MRFNEGNFPYDSITKFIAQNAAFDQGETATAFATVYKGEPIVFKLFTAPITEEVIPLIANEINVYQRLRGEKGIVNFYGCVVLNDESIVLLLENGGKPVSLGQSPLYGSYLQRLSALKEIAGILDKALGHSLVINDPNLANILYNEDKKVFNLIDFGFACEKGINIYVLRAIILLFSMDSDTFRRCDAYIPLWQYYINLVLMHYVVEKPDIYSANASYLTSECNNLTALEKLRENVRIQLADQNPDFVQFILHGLDPVQQKRPQSFKEVIGLLDVLQEAEERRAQLENNNADAVQGSPAGTDEFQSIKHPQYVKVAA